MFACTSHCLFALVLQICPKSRDRGHSCSPQPSLCFTVHSIFISMLVTNMKIYKVLVSNVHFFCEDLVSDYKYHKVQREYKFTVVCVFWLLYFSLSLNVLSKFLKNSLMTGWSWSWTLLILHFNPTTMEFPSSCPFFYSYRYVVPKDRQGIIHKSNTW